MSCRESETATHPHKLEDRPAFYALAPGGWRDLVTLLHPPYTAWHLSYVVIGAAVAPHLHGDRLLAALGAFFLAVGVAAHALDERHGHPLRTRLSDTALTVLATTGLTAATAIGVLGAIIVSPLLIPLVALGPCLALAYNLELANGRFHSDIWFALTWGGFPAFTGYFANALTVRPVGLLVTAACILTSLAQRRLSTPARDLRRRTAQLTGTQRFTDGHTETLDAESVAAPLEGALKALGLAHVVLAIGLLTARI